MRGCMAIFLKTPLNKTTMRRLLSVIVFLCIPLAWCHAQVDNYALSFKDGGKVTCGSMPELNNASSYTLQFWFNASKWTKDAQLLTLGTALTAKLGNEGELNLCINNSSAITVSSAALAPSSWSQVTFVNNNGAGKVYINNVLCKEFTAAAVNTDGSVLELGGGFEGRLDEVRIWSATLKSDFDFFYNNTLNKWAPQWDDLVAYYKFDQFTCNNVVDYKALYANTATNHHGIMGLGVERTKVTDNPKLPYLVHGAYCNNERFYDRGVEADQYLLSNDLIILGIKSFADGHLTYKTPCNHATATNCEYLSEYNGRSGVLSFKGTGSKLTCTKETFTPEIINGIASVGYTFEAWVYIDEWTEGAYLFRKETDDKSHGFSIRLGGETNHQLIARCDGNDFINQKALTAVGEWVHVAITTFQGAENIYTFMFSINGVAKWANPNVSAQSTNYTPTGMEGLTAYVGENFKGKLDDVCIWNSRFSIDNLKAHMNNGIPMPGLGKVVTADIMKQCNSFYRFDNADNIGYDSHSQDSWRDIMTSAYKGYRGWKVRISVEPHDGWQNTIADASKRQIFAQDLARLSEGYDGVELDLEWEYSNWTNYGLLAQAIREALPAGKTFQVSTHNVAYGYPVGKMQYVDGFTFQQYGPQNVHFKYSEFENKAKAFVNYGYPKDKIILSYATTTSKGFQNGSAITAIKGVRDGFMDDANYEPQEEVDRKEIMGYTYDYTGPLQCYKRSKYCTNNNLKGIFYWDMGNDVSVNHKYNLTKWSNYGLCSNVDLIVTEAEPNYPTAIDAVAADGTCSGKNSKVISNGKVVVKTATDNRTYTIDGKQLK